MPILILLYPFAEIAAWWWFISEYSFLDAVAWCVVSGFVGMWILRMQGGAAFAELQVSAQNGSLPPTRIVHRLLVSFGAFLLVIPGLIAKVIGAIFILPGFRHITVSVLLWRLGTKLAQGFVRFGNMGPMGGFVFTQGMRSGFRAGGFPQGDGPRPGFRDVEDAGPQVRDVIDVRATVLENKKEPSDGSDS